MKPLGVGFMLHPDAEYLSLCRDIIESEADYYEVSPETLWDVDARGNLVPSQVTDVFLEIKRRSGKPFVGHGLGLSPGTSATNPREDARLQKWLARIREDQKLFEYQWYTEHLGWANAEGMHAVLPLPLPPTEESARVVAERLSLLKPIIPTVGFENQVTYFTFGDARDEPPFWNRMCELGDLWLLLDLHNAYTQCLNCGVPLDEYLAKLDLSRVIEIHLSGGSESEAGWLPSGKVMRLDTHDNPIPDGVWEAFKKVRPRCKNLRGVTVERLNGTIERKDVAGLRDEVRRARQIFKSEYRNPKSEGSSKTENLKTGLQDIQRLLFAALIAEKPQQTLRDGLAKEKNLSAQERAWLEQLAKDDGFIISSLIVKKLRFERLQLSDAEMKELFEREPEKFVELFREYTAKVQPTGYFPSEEGKMFREWKDNKATNKH